MAYETIACLQDHGLEVIVDFEHGMDANCGAAKTAPHAIPISTGAASITSTANAQCIIRSSRIVICDTTGGANPEEVSKVIGELTKTYPEIGIDSTATRRGSASPTPCAILAGAVQVQGTLLGTGERCGNVNLTTLS